MKAILRETNIYGSGDDNICINGGYSAEIGCFGTDDEETGVLIIVDDGTLLEVKYGKNDDAIWGINVIRKGSLFDRLETCTDEGADIYSDIAIFKPGVKKIYYADAEHWRIAE